MDDAFGEQISQNDALFRAANEQIRDRAEQSDLVDAIPFLCECADPTCTKVVRLSLAEYARIRQDPTWFLNAAGHDDAKGAVGQLIERRPGYEIVAKTGRAAKVAEDLDPRART